MSSIAAFNPDAFLAPLASPVAGGEHHPNQLQLAGNSSKTTDLSTTSGNVSEDMRPSSERVPMPRAWALGLARLGEIATPKGAAPWRWRQVVEDAVEFARVWHVLAVEDGWTVGNVFGFDLRQPDSLLGLVLDIRGGSVFYIDPNHARIRRPDGLHYHYRRMPDDAPPLWLLKSIEL